MRGMSDWPFELSRSLEVLHRSFVFLGARQRGERPEILPLTRLGVFLAGVKPVFSRLQFSDHAIRMRLRKYLVGGKPN
jgi:hypothetical protein